MSTRFSPNETSIISKCPTCSGTETLFRELSKIKVGCITYGFYQCTGCSSGGLAMIMDNVTILNFYPPYTNYLSIPESTPQDIVSEFREAESCLSHNLYRASSALFRSTLEKILKANGYNQGNLKSKIDTAASDGVINDIMKQRAHNETRSLGNDVLHDNYREIKNDEVEISYKFVHRLIEEFYTYREDVEKKLIEKKRLSSN